MISPFTPQEMPMAMQTLLANKLFVKLSHFIYPTLSFDQIKSKLLAISSVDDFQRIVMCDAFDNVCRASMSGFDVSLSGKLEKDKAYLFVTNHRDITLDALILETVLCRHGFITPHIAFGTNLMKVPFFDILSRANKMFTVERGGSPRAYYESMMQMAAYIRRLITVDHQSVWIAQRNGRTKNGLDITDPALVKMFNLGTKEQLCDVLRQLNIVPVSVSYQYEPCAAFKAIELAKSRNGKYHKRSNEDTKSVLYGLFQPKGNVTVSVGDPVDVADLDACHDDARMVAALLDDKIRAGYHLNDTNYLAADRRAGTNRFAGHYSDATVQSFDTQLIQLRAVALHQSVDQPDDFMQVVEQTFIDIYANPVERV